MDGSRHRPNLMFSLSLSLSLSLVVGLVVFLTPPLRVEAQGTPGIYLAKLYRDAIGVGHVWGDTDEDVSYGLGRLVARDKPMRTMLSLTIASGKLAEALGAHKEGADEHWIYVDRKAHAYQVPQRASSLWASYFLPGATAEEIEIRKWIVAYVEGIKDEIAIQTPGVLASTYAALSARADWPYGNEYKYSQAQYERLFTRALGVGDYKIEYWEPFAACLYWIGRIPDALGDDPNILDGPNPLKSFFDFGSNAWGVTDHATQNGFGYLQADSHNPPDLGHTVRFKSRLANQKLDAGGVTWEGFGPFLLNGAFTRNCAWATCLHYCDDHDVFKYDARYYNGTFQYNVSTTVNQDWKDLAPQTLPIRWYDFSQSTLSTMTKTVYYLQPTSSESSAAVLWAADPENDTWSSADPPPEIRVSRLASLESGVHNVDPPVDMARTLYEMITAGSAEDLLTNALGAYPWTWPLQFTIGSGISGSVTTMQLINVPIGRVPFRHFEYPAQSPPTTLYFWNYRFCDTDKQKYPDAEWIIDSTLGRMFHPVGHFPAVKAHDPPVNDPVIKFLSNGNNTQQWVFGRNTPFPGKATGEEEYATGYKVEPRYKFIFNELPYQVNPLFTNWYDYTQRWLIETHENGGVSPSISLSFGEGRLVNAFGYHQRRQEWMVNRLQRLYEGDGPPSQGPREFSEQDMKDLIVDRIDSAAWYFKEMKEGIQEKNWFQTARDYLDSLDRTYEAQMLQLIDEFDAWATDGEHFADLSVETGDYAQTPLKWHIFWYQFKERDTSPLYHLPDNFGKELYGAPYHYYWPHATTTLSYYYVGTTNKIGQALEEAVVLTLSAMAAISPDYRLKHLLEVSIPFTEVKLETVGSGYCLKNLVFGAWGLGGRNYLSPKRETFFGGRLPLLVRLRKGEGPANDRKVWVMNNCIVSDLVNVLAEWQGTEGRARYEGSYRKMAAGDLYEWPLTETHADLTFIDDFTNLPPIESSRRK